MKVLYVNSGPSSVHESLDRYIHLTLCEMDIDYKLFDLTAHAHYFNAAFDAARESYGVDYSLDALYRYASAPLLQLVSEFEPDLVLTLRGVALPEPVVRAIHRMGVMVALWAVDDPYELEETLVFAGAYDFVFTSETAAVNIYREAGCDNVFQLPLAAFSKVYRRSLSPQFASDICFVGTAYDNRVALFRDIAGYLLASGLNVKIVGDGWDVLRGLGLESCIVAREAHAPEAAKYFAGARINLNIHRIPDAAITVNGVVRDVEALSPNSRTFEIAACGGFQLTDNSRPELYRHFEIGREIDTFASTEELIAKLDHYLANDEERSEIARTSKERCLRDHTFRNRLEFVLDTTLRKDSRRVIHKTVEATGEERPFVGKKDAAFYQKIQRAIVQVVPPTSKRVLDVGCGEGLLGETLKSLGIKEVIGVELNDNFAGKAKGRLDRVIVGDVEEVELPFRNSYFDCLIYSNVLEHLRDPRKLLAKQRRFLAPDGQLIASISNTLYFPVIKELLRGRWRYESAGVLDNSHLRYFTLREIGHVFRWAGFEIEVVEGIASDTIDMSELELFVKKMKPLNIVPESLLVEAQYAHYLVVAKKAKTDSRQGVSLSLVKS